MCREPIGAIREIREQMVHPRACGENGHELHELDEGGSLLLRCGKTCSSLVRDQASSVHPHACEKT
jgi:hypothetical protein